VLTAQSIIPKFSSFERQKVTTFSITTLSIKGISMTLRINDSVSTTLSLTKLSIKCPYAGCRFAECRILFILMLNVIMLSVVMLSVVMPIDFVNHFTSVVFDYKA
jgi:hypothetical protein